MARTVLLADDSVTAQNMGRRILMDAGYEVITVNNGSAALKKIHESPPDLIVLDVYMPGYGGLEVCQRLKESGETMRIPVLLTVGKMEPFKSDEAKRVRADGHIVKPFDASELLAALTKLEDRIVPHTESQRGRKGKGEKKSRLWPTGETQGDWTDGVAYLAEVKEREAHGELVVDPEIEKAEERVDDAEIPSPASEKQPQASAVAAALPPLAPPREFEVQETVAPDTASDEPTPVSPADEDRGAADRAPITAIEAEGPVNAPEIPQPTQEETSISQQAPETSAEAESAPARRSRWVAEAVAVTAEEASLELEQEMLKARAAAPGSTEAQGDAQELASQPQGPVDDASQVSIPSSPTESAAEAGQDPETSDSGATFAAVAGASAADGGSLIQAQSSPESQGEAPPPSEARAAWENWQRIRDSVISAQEPGALAGSVGEVLQTIAPQAAQASDQSDGGPVLENAALASIVESVLAELKPKLMEEIAKKLKK